MVTLDLLDRDENRAPALSIIIVNYNTRDILRDCLQSITTHDHGVALEVIVVDNASHDGSAAMVESEFPEVRVVANEENVGFSAANNRGMRRCRGDFVLLLNSDTIVLPGTLRRMVEFARRHPEAGICGCKLVRPNGELDWACRRGFPTPMVALFKFLGVHRVFPRSRLFGRYNMTYRDPDRTYEVDSVVGAFMLVRRPLLEKLRGLDESFFMYGEDLDLCFRAKELGARVFYVGSNHVIHHKGASSRLESFRMNYHFHRAMILFHRKHLRSRYPAVVNAMTYSGIGLRFSALVLRHYLRQGAGWITGRFRSARSGPPPEGGTPVPVGGDVVV